MYFSLSFGFTACIFTGGLHFMMLQQELEAAAKYWVSQLRASDLKDDQGDRFRENIKTTFREKFKDHWYPNQPERGQAYRSISIDRGVADPLLDEAARAADINDFRRRLPADMDMIMWVDPGNVSVRYNNSNRTHVLFQSSVAPAAQLPKRSRRNSERSYIDRTWSQNAAAAAAAEAAAAEAANNNDDDADGDGD